jgi:hypothetical protein
MEFSMRIAILLSCLVLAAACGRKQDVYIVTGASAAEPEQTDGTN